ncbi:MAG TPA: beta-ketoacyl synthase N-terminal-like domain-containing protein [Bacteroidales bacterium]|nr:beta-ketoacyl synthase N-terminal-like domain-containing protein [Bacteroidales bacterium]
MPDVFVCGENVITSLGFTIEEHLQKIKEDISGVTLVNDKVLYPEDFYASLVDTERLENEFSALADPKKFTRFEKLMILSASKALKSNPLIDAASPKTLFVLSTTKGNIDLLEEKKRDIFEPERIHLWKAAEIIATFFNNPKTPVVVSNACISGVLAISNAASILKNSDYENIIVIGGDIASEFVVSGFLSFKSLSFGICKPFDINRDGLNLGEGAGTLILTKGIEKTGNGIRVKVLGGACNNDANHISGPSRTGEGLMLAVTRAIKNSGLTVDQIDFISAHGTATPYNDEMESKAFSSAGLSDAPVNSLKAYFGHTLGGAGTIESVMAIQGMRQNLLFNTLGFKEYGLPEKINVIGRLTEKEQKYILKTASGFGGCNAAVVFAKE